MSKQNGMKSTQVILTMLISLAVSNVGCTSLDLIGHRMACAEAAAIGGLATRMNRPSPGKRALIAFASGVALGLAKEYVIDRQPSQDDIRADFEGAALGAGLVFFLTVTSDEVEYEHVYTPVAIRQYEEHEAISDNEGFRRVVQTESRAGTHRGGAGWPAGWRRHRSSTWGSPPWVTERAGE
jgi:hypothetical protein